jgi:outer membrane protein OmpA-like peptidoglycan-associated protein
MEENDEIYVMADANSPQLTSIKPKRKINWIILGSLGAFIAIFGVILAYVLMAKTPPAPKIAKNGSVVTTLTKPLQEELTVRFSFNSAEIKPADISQIESLWSKAKDGKGKVIIAGHADDLGAEEYNQELSQKRAENVAKVLQQIGIDNHYQVTIQGFGETKPVAENTTEQGRVLNRRVEILFHVQK